MIKNKKRFWGKVLLIMGLLLGGILISESSEKETYWRHIRANYATSVCSGKEEQALASYEGIGVCRIIRKKRECYIKNPEPRYPLDFTLCATIFEAVVVDPLYGELKRGQIIYIMQEGTSAFQETDGELAYLREDSMVDETGGFYRRGERLLLCLSRLDSSWSYQLDMNPMIPLYYSAVRHHQVVFRNGSLGYRNGTVFQPGELGYDYCKPFWITYDTVDEIRASIPGFFAKAAKWYGTPITNEELQQFSRKRFAEASAAMTQGREAWKAFVEEYRAKGK